MMDTVDRIFLSVFASVIVTSVMLIILPIGLSEPPVVVAAEELHPNLDRLDAALAEMGSHLFDDKAEKECDPIIVFRDIATGEEFRLTQTQYQTVLVHIGNALLHAMEVLNDVPKATDSG